MNKRKIQVTKIVQFILGLMMVGSFLFFVLGQVFLPAENNIEESMVGAVVLPFKFRRL